MKNHTRPRARMRRNEVNLNAHKAWIKNQSTERAVNKDKEFENESFAGDEILVADWTGTKFKNVSFNGANVNGSVFVECTFEDCDIRGANMSGSDMTDCVWTNCQKDENTNLNNCIGDLP